MVGYVWSRGRHRHRAPPAIVVCPRLEVRCSHSVIRTADRRGRGWRRVFGRSNRLTSSEAWCWARLGHGGRSGLCWIWTPSTIRNVLFDLGFAVTANLFVRRDFFLRANGFDASLHMYGDYDFVARCRAAGAALAFDPAVLVRHQAKAGGRAFLQKLWAANRASAAERAEQTVPCGCSCCAIASRCSRLYVQDAGPESRLPWIASGFVRAGAATAVARGSPSAAG